MKDVGWEMKEIGGEMREVGGEIRVFKRERMKLWGEIREIDGKIMKIWGEIDGKTMRGNEGSWWEITKQSWRNNQSSKILVPLIIRAPKNPTEKRKLDNSTQVTHSVTLKM